MMFTSPTRYLPQLNDILPRICVLLDRSSKSLRPDKISSAQWGFILNARVGVAISRHTAAKFKVVSHTKQKKRMNSID